MEEIARPTWMEVLRPLIYSDLLSNIAFVVIVVLLALAAVGIYKLVTRAIRPGKPPELLEEADVEPTDTEEPGDTMEVSEESPEGEAEAEETEEGSDDE